MKDGIIEKAQESAENTLKTLFGNAITGYTIEFQWPETSNN